MISPVKIFVLGPCCLPLICLAICQQLTPQFGKKFNVLLKLSITPVHFLEITADMNNTIRTTIQRHLIKQEVAKELRSHEPTF